MESSTGTGYVLYDGRIGKNHYKMQQTESVDVTKIKDYVHEAMDKIVVKQR